MPIITPGGFNGRYIMPGTAPSLYDPESFDYELVFWGDPASMQVTNVSGIDYVTTWANKAATGSNYDWIYQDAATAPTYTESSDINGYPAMVFGGNFNQYLQMGSTGLDMLSNVPGLTIAMVFKPVNPVSDPASIFWASVNGSSDPRFNYGYLTTGQRFTQVRRLDDGTDYTYVDSQENPADNTVYWDICRMDYSHANVSMMNKGLVIRPATPAASEGNTPNTDSNEIILGAIPGGAWPANMQLVEMLIWRGPIAAKYLLKTSIYFNEKYCHFNANNTDYYVYIGDSNIAGDASGAEIPEEYRIQHQVEALLPSQPGITRVHYNYGLFGLKMEDTLGYLEFVYNFTGIFYPNARNVFIIVGSGTNDIWAGTDPATILGYYQTLVATYQSLPTSPKVYPWTTLPLGDPDFNEQINILVEGMENYWRDFGWNGLIPANSLILPPPSVDFMPDDTHLSYNTPLPSTVGVGKVAQAVVDTIWS